MVGNDSGCPAGFGAPRSGIENSVETRTGVCENNAQPILRVTAVPAPRSSMLAPRRECGQRKVQEDERFFRRHLHSRRKQSFATLNLGARGTGDFAPLDVSVIFADTGTRLDAVLCTATRRSKARWATTGRPPKGRRAAAKRPPGGRQAAAGRRPSGGRAAAGPRRDNVLPIYYSNYYLFTILFTILFTNYIFSIYYSNPLILEKKNNFFFQNSKNWNSK